MPYIKEHIRSSLDPHIDELIKHLLQNIDSYSNTDKQTITNEELLGISGDINYAFSRIISKLMGNISYPKVAIITGVLENIKQEFYRRAATPYENKKIFENGDLKEYKLLN
jgi:hypothetical protein